MAQRTDDPSATPTAIVSVVFTILVVAIVIGLQALYGWAEHKTVADKVLNTPATAKNVIAVGATAPGAAADSLASFSSNGPVQGVGRNSHVRLSQRAGCFR